MKEVGFMAIRYKRSTDVLGMLKNAGYSTYRIRKEKIFGESVLTKLRRGDLPSWAELDKLCFILKCQPWDLIEYVPEDPGQ